MNRADTDRHVCRNLLDGHSSFHQGQNLLFFERQCVDNFCG